MIYTFLRTSSFYREERSGILKTKKEIHIVKRIIFKWGLEKRREWWVFHQKKSLKFSIIYIYIYIYIYIIYIYIYIYISLPYIIVVISLFLTMKLDCTSRTSFIQDEGQPGKSIYRYIYLSIYLFVYLSIYLSIDLSAYRIISFNLNIFA